MLAIDRQRAILDRIEVGGSVRTAEMAEILEVTEETIRRDFEKLEEAGHIKRAHGGALKPAIGGPWRDLPFGERHSYQVAEKENVARAALDEVSEGQVLFLDASSTVLHLARNLPDVQLTVITNALQVLWSLRNRSKLTVLSTGGRLDINSASFIGPLAEDALLHLHVDTFFFSCRGIDPVRGLSEANDSHAAYKRLVMQSADKSICLADHTKLGLRSAFFFAAPGEPDLIITDGAADLNTTRKIRSRGGHLRITN
jgi:DeoR/GlpR family transcriptional regulator of sugar metabolism